MSTCPTGEARHSPLLCLSRVARRERWCGSLGGAPVRYQLTPLPLHPAAVAAAVLSPRATDCKPGCTLWPASLKETTGAPWRGLGWAAKRHGARRCGALGRREIRVVGGA